MPALQIQIVQRERDSDQSKERDGVALINGIPLIIERNGAVYTHPLWLNWGNYALSARVSSPTWLSSTSLALGLTLCGYR